MSQYVTNKGWPKLNGVYSKCHTMTVCPETCVKMFIFKVDVQSDHLETKFSWVKVSQGKNVTVDVSSGSKFHSGRNVFFLLNTFIQFLQYIKYNVYIIRKTTSGRFLQNIS
jgi:hypothetical protein